MTRLSGIICRFPHILGFSEVRFVQNFFVRDGVGEGGSCFEETVIESQNRGLQEYSRNVVGNYLPGSLYSYSVPTVFLGVLFGGPHRGPFSFRGRRLRRRGLQGSGSSRG